jgi:hypothetical protein
MTLTTTGPSLRSPVMVHASCSYARFPSDKSCIIISEKRCSRVYCGAWRPLIPHKSTVTSKEGCSILDEPGQSNSDFFFPFDSSMTARRVHVGPPPLFYALCTFGSRSVRLVVHVSTVQSSEGKSETVNKEENSQRGETSGAVL